MIKMIKMLREWWWWRRMRPGLFRAAMLAEMRAYSHPNARHLGPEMNLKNLSDDLYKLYRGESLT